MHHFINAWVLSVFALFVCHSVIAAADIADSGDGTKETAGFLFPTETYVQELQIELHDAAQLSKLSQISIEVLPLYNNAQWSWSSRWDDNNVAGDKKMHALLQEHDFKATWYLNDIGKGGMTAEVAQQLVQGGHSIGSHSLTHPYLPYLNKNRIFEEVMRNRIQWEAAVEQPINSYAFSYLAYGNKIMPEAKDDIYYCLARAGYIHVPLDHYKYHWNPQKIIVCPLLPGELTPVEKVLAAAQKALADALKQKEQPHLSFAMHADTH